LLTASSLANRAGILSHLDDICWIARLTGLNCPQNGVGPAAAAGNLPVARVANMCRAMPVATAELYFNIRLLQPDVS
jgi:hypothetical protein